MNNFISGVATHGETLAVDAGKVAGDPVQTGYLNGVCFNDRDTDGNAVVDTQSGNIYDVKVRNVKTYSGGAEETYGAITIGDKIYYDGSSTMPSGYFLSTSPEDEGEAATKQWGVAMEDMDTATAASSTIRVKMCNPAI
jgi:hypothetical protein